MKLRYFKAKNVLSFGEEDTTLEFSSYNIIAGPNDSGKTNLFRALDLIEVASEFGKPSISEIIFQGDLDRSLRLEVGVELDDSELELLVTQILCSEVVSVVQPQDITEGVSKNVEWKSILMQYGYQILLKSFRSISFVLSKDELNISEPKMTIQMSDGTESLYLNRNDYLSETVEELGGYQRTSLVKKIVEDFTSRFGDIREPNMSSLIQAIQRLEKESPTLVKLLKGKLDGSPRQMVELRGSDWSEYLNTLRGEPILAKLSKLCEQKGIERQRLYPWEILRQMYKKSLVRLHELRTSPPTLTYSGSDQGLKEATILGSELALKLFTLRNSGISMDRQKYNRIQEEFKNLTHSEFDIAVRTKEATEVSEGELGVESSQRSEPPFPSTTEFLPLRIMREQKTTYERSLYPSDRWQLSNPHRINSKWPL